MYDVWAGMSCLPAFFESGEAGEVEGLSRGFRRFQTAAVGSQWKEAEGVGDGYVHLVRKEDFKSLISSSTSSSYWAVWTSIKVYPHWTRGARTLIPCHLSGLEWMEEGVT